MAVNLNPNLNLNLNPDIGLLPRLLEEAKVRIKIKIKIRIKMMSSAPLRHGARPCSQNPYTLFRPLPTENRRPTGYLYHTL